MKIYQVDAFTDVIFKGNPAGVCILSRPAHEKWMQDIAMEMNLSETAFLYKQGEGFFKIGWTSKSGEYIKTRRLCDFSYVMKSNSLSAKSSALGLTVIA